MKTPADKPTVKAKIVWVKDEWGYRQPKMIVETEKKSEPVKIAEHDINVANEAA